MVRSMVNDVIEKFIYLSFIKKERLIKYNIDCLVNYSNKTDLNSNNISIHYFIYLFVIIEK